LSFKNFASKELSYDLLHLTCAEKAGADVIFTFNVMHFVELAGRLREKITAP
jgi:hypothetical protein